MADDKWAVTFNFPNAAFTIRGLTKDAAENLARQAHYNAVFTVTEIIKENAWNANMDPKQYTINPDMLTYVQVENDNRPF